MQYHFRSGWEEFCEYCTSIFFPSSNAAIRSLNLQFLSNGLLSDPDKKTKVRNSTAADKQRLALRQQFERGQIYYSRLHYW